MAPIIKIAIIQFRPKPLAVAENFTLSAQYIREAASQGADIAVLPEYHLTSWCPDEPGFIAACKDSMPYLERYQSLSSELNINIVPGTICEVHPSPKDIEIRNMAYFLSPNSGGAISGSYQKRNLWHPERPHLTAAPSSSPHRAFPTPLKWPDGTPVKIGLLICWDAIFPESFRPLVTSGADVIITPAFWLLDEDFGEVAPEKITKKQQEEKNMLQSLIVTRAYENTCTVVFVNAGGGSMVAGAGVIVDDDLNSDRDGGGSVMMKPMGVEEEGVRVVRVDLEEDRKLEGRYKIREDLRSMMIDG